MAASYVTAPAAWNHSSSGSPGGTISAEPAGNNLKLIVSLTCDDNETWTISTMTVGGQSASTVHAGVEKGRQQIRQFEYDNVKIDAMSGVAISYADVSAFINPLNMTHYWVQDTLQDAAVATSNTSSSNTMDITTVGNTTADLTVAVVNIYSQSQTIDSYDTLSEDQSGASGNDFSGIANGLVTDTTHTITHTGSGNFCGQILIHKAAVGGSTIIAYASYMYNQD